ncbi:DUF4233 domain-containing protein [Propionibacteriaceae bacterium G57]|uniref:DUF4233 domain-containing protein n=1 Tax=Aestuariimicrobium sp. G57 TaxID=3418485 RepID=UPI003DA735A5
MILPPTNPLLRAMAMTLWFEVIIFILALPGMLLIDHRDTALSITIVVVACVAAVVAAMRVKRPWGQVLGLVVQAGAIAMGLMTSMMFAVGIIFAVVWLMCVILGRRLESQAAARDQ